jgi:hypothetical protein
LATLTRSPLNGAIETGLRALAILGAIYPRQADMAALVLFDYLVVHSGDVPSGPPSLHPPSPLRAGEVAVRRALLEDGITLYRSRGLIHVSFEQSGIEYRADDFASAFMDALASHYVRGLRQRCDWLATLLETRTYAEVQQTFTSSLGRWREEFATLGSADLDELRAP